MVFRKVLPTIGIGSMLLLIGGLDTLFAQCANWRKIQTPLQGQINGVAMSPDGRHIILSGGFALHSSDGGVTWEQITSGPDIMTFGDNSHLFGVASSQGCNLPNGSAALYRSTDYGKTWDETPARAPMCFREVFFLDSLHGWAVGSNKDSIVVTNDGGKTLSTRPFGLPGFDARGVTFIDTLQGFVAGRLVGSDSAVLRTSDGGYSWTVLPVGIFSFVSIALDFVDTANGWLIGTDGGDRKIYHTSNGGRNWTEQGPLGGFLEQVSAVDSLHAWTLADDFGPLIWRTVDAGKSWELEYSGPGGFPTDFVMVNSSHGVTVGDLGTVLIYAPVVTLGDLNGDDQITATDIVLEVNWVFLGLPFSCLQEAADVNCDGLFTPTDIVLLLNHFFLGAQLPCNK